MRIYNYQPPKENNSNSFKKRKFFKFKFTWKKSLTWTFRIFALGVLFVALLFLYYAKDLPDPNKLLERTVPESTKIFDRDGGLLYEIHGEYKRTLVNLDQINQHLKNATIAIEDKDFYNHGGISFTGIARAIMVDILTGTKAQGGSTITQQFVKKSILTDDKSWDRKIREIILALAIDSRFTKEEILKLYLNEIPYGRNAYGIEAASLSYFNKSAKDLSLAESAYLAAMPQAPTRYNPFGPNRQALDNRKNTILAAMREQGYITSEQEQKAKEEKPEFNKITTGIKAPHFVLWVQDYLANKYGEKTLEEGGLNVYTTLNPKLQSIAEEAVKTGVEKIKDKYNANNSALVAIDPKTGQILAMVGSKDYFGDVVPEGCKPGKDCLFEPNVNVALSQRQPGSSFKPYVYATAFKKDFGYSPASMLIDVVTNFGTFNGKPYIPGNYNGQSYGPLSMRKAMAGSLNIPAVKTLALIGVENAVQTARDLGITSPLVDCGLSLVLGGCEVRLLDHVAAMSVFANMGVKNEKTAILKIEDKDGKIIEEFKENPQDVIDPEAVYQVVNIMTDNDARSYIFGVNSPLTLPGRTVAAKTGTTNNWHDGWTMGFTPSLAAGVWTGNNDGTLLKKGADGVLVAAPIWQDFMKKALEGTPAEDFTVPSGIQKITVDEVSGKLPTDATPNTKVETFASYNAPTDFDNVHIKVAIDSSTGLPATNLTPPNLIVYKIQSVLHSERRDNPEWENPVIEWALAHGYFYPSEENIGFPETNSGQNLNVTIAEPQNGTTVKKTPFQVSVNINTTFSVSRVDLSIDGEFYQSLNSQPFVFSVNKNLSNGKHTLAIKVVDSNGNTGSTSSELIYEGPTSFSLTQPQNNSLVQFPIMLSAESQEKFDSVNFYYINSKGETKLIDSANSSNQINNFKYSLTWTTGPATGSYKVYAQSSTGATTNKVTISVP